MGKIRAKKRAARDRYESTGIPSVVNTVKEEVEDGTHPMNPLPLLQRLSNPTPSERRWACQSLSHLVLDHTSLDELIRGRVVRKLTPLLLDESLSVREAATGALRNMSSVDRHEVHEYIAREDIMTPLTAMLNDCLSRLLAVDCLTLTPPADVSMDTGLASTNGCRVVKSKERKDVDLDHRKKVTDRDDLLRIIEESLCLLWNMSENSCLVVEVFNRDNLLPLTLQLLQPAQYPLSLVTATAQLLHTVTEDNTVACQLLCSSQDHLSHLETVLVTSDLPGSSGHLLLIKTAVAGVLQNILPCLPDHLKAETLRAVLQVLDGVIETDVMSFLPALTANTEQATSSESTPTTEVEEIKSLLSAQQLAFEVLANVCYTESDDDDGEWEDCEVEELIGEEAVGEVVMDETEESGTRSFSLTDFPCLQLIIEGEVHTRVCGKLVAMNTMLYQACQATRWGNTLIKRLSLVQSSALLALQNLISSLPVESWGGADSMVALWQSLFNLPEGYSDSTFPVVGVLLGLVKKMSSLGVTEFFTVDQLLKLSEVGRIADEVTVRADVMALLGTAAKISLDSSSPVHLLLFTVIGTTLRDCVAKDASLMVVSQALDSIFDLFGNDRCPQDLFVSLSLLPVLKESASTFVARFRVEKKMLGQNRLLVQNVMVNLTRFIEYMSSRK